ncbi:unnamed protein product [Schistocephalus solidus]|uniref:Secreted protein n=1 Tax=Schistocephalus solidus TaxID=70667 RepID=A0A183SP42_SCHSO|nr:unnamed protein product [Schistocephalus solidus]
MFLRKHRCASAKCVPAAGVAMLVATPDDVVVFVIVVMVVDDDKVENDELDAEFVDIEDEVVDADDVAVVSAPASIARGGSAVSRLVFR